MQISAVKISEFKIISANSVLDMSKMETEKEISMLEYCTSRKAKSTSNRVASFMAAKAILQHKEFC